MPANYSILKSNPAFFGHFSVAEFTIITATLQNNQASKSTGNQRSIHSFLLILLSAPLLPFILLLTPIITVSLKDRIFYFHDRDANNERRQEDLAEFIENLNFTIDGQIYADKI